MTLPRITYKLTDKRIPAASGLGLVGDILEQAGFARYFSNLCMEQRRSKKKFNTATVFITFLALLCMGKPDYECVKELQQDAEVYQSLLHLPGGFPSPETLRQRMDTIGDCLRSEILSFNVQLLNRMRVNVGSLINRMVPVDIDVTPMDNSKTNKEGVGFTYKRFWGFAPIMAYIGTEGYLCGTELRNGSQHCQNGTPAFLREILPKCRQITKNNLLVRMDSGNDAAENVGILLEHGAYYIIKRNLRRENREDWSAFIREHCIDIREPREGKKVYVGQTFKDIFYTDSSGQEKSIRNRIVYEMTERTSLSNGQMLIEPSVDINMFWTNIGDSDQAIIDLYHAHGECEQYHSEIKTDMDVERLPSGKFTTNALVLELTMIAYNILRIIGQESVRQNKAPVKRKIHRRRIRTVMQNLIYLSALLVSHARRWVLLLSKCNAWSDCFCGLALRFQSI